MVQNMNDTTSRHPSINSTETAEDGSVQFVTIFSYQKLKFQLYQIASPMLENATFHQASSTSEASAKVMDIHERLLAWFASLPQELRLNPPRTDGTQHHTNSVETAFGLQALALQLAYDNIQILLHKPMLCSEEEEDNVPGHAHTPPSGNGIPSRVATPVRAMTAVARSKLQCWESAIRTSRLTSQSAILEVATSTHAASYIGIHLFTSGMILSTVALSRPLSSQAQHAKQAIGRILQILTRLQHQTLLSKQSATVLETLVRVILSKEMDAIIGKSSETANNDSIEAVQAKESVDPRNLLSDASWPNYSPNTQDVGVGGANMDTFDLMLGATDFQEGVADIEHGKQRCHCRELVIAAKREVLNFVSSHE